MRHDPIPDLVPLYVHLDRVVVGGLYVGKLGLPTTRPNIRAIPGDSNVESSSFRLGDAMLAISSDSDLVGAEI